MSADVAIPGDEARIVLVRHGQTEYNREGRWQGLGSDVPLNDTGRAEAARVGEALAGAFGGSVAALYTSDLARAHETAEIIGARLGLAAVDEPALRELSHGRWEGLTHAEVAKRWPDELAEYEAHPYVVRRGGGDSYQDLETRLWPALERLSTVHRGERIVCVSHGGPIRLALSKVLDRPLTDRDAFGVVNGSWFEVARGFVSAPAGASVGGWWLESSGKAG